MTSSPEHDDEALGRLVDEIEARRARNEELDARLLAE